MSQEITQPKPDNRKHDDLILNIRNGTIKIPKFQRDFVWELQKSADLLDSIIKGYPIGTFIIWKTRERLRSIKNLGNVDLPDTPSGESVQYVLDGQQRLASLFVVKEGLEIQKDNKRVDYKNIFIDLDKFSDVENVVSIEKPLGKYVTVYELLNRRITSFIDKYSREHVDKIDLFQRRFETYDFSTIVLEEYPIEKAVDIFNRINTTGKVLTLFEIMVAKTYDEKNDFDLGDKYNELEEELSPISYEIPTAQLLQCISMNVTQECTRKTILELSKKDIINIWNDTIISIKSAIEHFKKVYKIPVSHLLPYPALIVPFSYFFFRNKRRPTPNQDKYLQEYFWRSALTSRFTSSVEAKLAQDGKIMDVIFNKEVPFYDKEFKVTLTKNDIKEWSFSSGDSISKAVMCVLAFFEPKSFNDDTEVTLDNSYLIRGNSKNYHHFFPKAFLKKQGIEDRKRNLLPNITLVDDFLNKREIKAKPPSQYMKEFEKINPHLDETMKTHLIYDLNDYGIWDNDYEKFLDRRVEQIWTELKTRFGSN